MTPQNPDPVADTWTNRDLPVLKAVVEIFEATGKTKIGPSEIAAKANLDPETTERALRALYREPYLEPASTDFGGHFVAVGPPTGDALRVAGQWPTPENLLERLVAALDAAGDDESFDEPERSKLKQAAAWLGSFASGVAVSALGGAGGHMLSG
ncbi:hypothetical protein A5692_12905 [Mycobacterium sp. E342]|uniref:hypothetical protein n=1 Tax=Mycobacterium sp. E342 TaxID=1834147 RepID=UPI00080011AC|nr:hypothetical protein [Mycobacterium sp. E342]OBH34569.1 hypothetical protein A5692_12905 [Mycobacterium sp. E342]